MGRSYGDSANAVVVLQTMYLDHYIAFDAAQGLLTCEAGTTLRDILTLIVPQGWFLPVTPGTSYVTVGGAIAGDVHGKNHHKVGTFGQHVQSITMLLGTGETVTTSPTELQDLFDATCGGMGLTGVILTATFKLIRITSSSIVQRTIKTACLEEACELFDTHSQDTYSVAWIDCLARGKQLGRSVLMIGEHATDGNCHIEDHGHLSVPIHTPSSWLNRWSVSLFNGLYYAAAASDRVTTIPMHSYFYPLDSIGGWNKLYGKSGFVQYQCVVPKENGMPHLRAILTKIAESGMGSFLAVLKQFGPQNEHFLSFPMAGYTLALDFKIQQKTLALLSELDAMVIHMRGRVYLAKDARMSETSFKSMYPTWSEFEAVREKYGAIGRFVSAQSLRLGLQ